jgi:hypothetical protein
LSRDNSFRDFLNLFIRNIPSTTFSAALRSELVANFPVTLR